MGTFAIRVLDYAVNSEQLFGFNFLFLVSCSDYIDIIEYDNLLRNLRYHDIIITVVAGTQSRQLNIEKNEYIIYYDMCVLRYCFRLQTYVVMFSRKLRFESSVV